MEEDLTIHILIFVNIDVTYWMYVHIYNLQRLLKSIVTTILDTLIHRSTWNI